MGRTRPVRNTASLLKMAKANGSVNVIESPPLQTSSETFRIQQDSAYDSTPKSLMDDDIHDMPQDLRRHPPQNQEPGFGIGATSPVQVQNEPDFFTKLATIPLRVGLQQKRRRRRSIPHWRRLRRSMRECSCQRILMLGHGEMPANTAPLIQRFPSLVGMKRAQTAPVHIKHSRFHVLTIVPRRTDLIFGRKGSITGIWHSHWDLPYFDRKEDPGLVVSSPDSDASSDFDTVTCPEAGQAPGDQEEEAGTIRGWQEYFNIRRLDKIRRRMQHKLQTTVNDMIFLCFDVGRSFLKRSVWSVGHALRGAGDFAATPVQLMWSQRGAMRHHMEILSEWLHSLALVLLSLYACSQSLSRNRTRAKSFAVVSMLLAVGYAYDL